MGGFFFAACTLECEAVPQSFELIQDGKSYEGQCEWKGDKDDFKIADCDKSVGDDLAISLKRSKKGLGAFMLRRIILL